MLRGPLPGGVFAPMRQCVAVRSLPLGVLAVTLPGGGSAEIVAPLDPWLRCELGMWHEGEHADHLQDWPDDPVHAVWARWVQDGPLRVESVAWCGVNSPDGETACTLYRDHERAHSWRVTDPRVEALRRDMERIPAAWWAHLLGSRRWLDRSPFDDGA